MHALIAFDLDGVLYSAEPFLGEAYREAIATVNAQRPGSFARVPTTREILDHVGWPVPVILDRLFPHIERTAVDLLYAETLHVIVAHVARGEGTVFPGVADTLSRLQADGLTLVVASNGRRPYVEAVLHTFGLARYFADLIAVDHVELKEKADLLRAYLVRHRLTAAQMIMVGDRTSDVDAARSVGCRFIGCDYGHGHRDEIAEVGLIVSAFDQLPVAITATLALPSLGQAG